MTVIKTTEYYALHMHVIKMKSTGSKITYILALENFAKSYIVNNVNRIINFLGFR